MPITTASEEQKSTVPLYREYVGDEELIAGAFEAAQAMVKSLGCKRSDVLLVAATPDLLSQMRAKAEAGNKPVEVIRARGDVGVVERAEDRGRFVLGGIDYVGGLEFSGVIIVGADDGRLPPTEQTGTSESRHFVRYASHNRLYVAVTRAKYRVELLGVQGRGPSPLLEKAFESESLVRDAY